MSGSVYNVHCRTFERALKLCGVAYSKHEGGIATRGLPLWSTFRAFPQYRDEFAKVLRSMVALSIRIERLHRRVGK